MLFRSGAEAVDVRHGDVVRFEHLEHPHLVLERVHAVIGLAALAPPVQRQPLPVALQLQEPRRAPALLPLERGNAAAELALDPAEPALPGRRELRLAILLGSHARTVSYRRFRGGQTL